MAVDAGGKYESVTVDTGDHSPIGEDEPVFMLRAQDALAADAIRHYIELCKSVDRPPVHIENSVRALEHIEDWQSAHPDLVKYPD